MFCPKCGSEENEIIQETKPMTVIRLIGVVAFFPLGLLLLIRGKKTVAICKKCGNKYDI